MDEDARKWNKDIKSYEEKMIKGNNLLKHYMPNYDVFKETDLYKNEISYILVEKLKEEIKDIENIVYDEKTDELFVITSNNQYKFKSDNYVILLNDLPIETDQLYIPDKKVLVKK